MIIDTHAHIYVEELKSDRQGVLERAKQIGISKIYMPNIDRASIDHMKSIQNMADGLYPMMGLHPCSVKADYIEVLDLMERELNGYEYFGIGETGIDLYWDPSTYDMQLESLKIHCRWASEKKLPIILHTRNANEQVISFFENCKTKPAKGIFHCFSGTLDEIKRIDQLGDYYFGIGGVITYKNAGLFELIPHIPMQKIVVETDSPYLAPAPHRGKKNEPAFILHVIEKLAQALKINLQECKKILFENTNRLFSN